MKKSQLISVSIIMTMIAPLTLLPIPAYAQAQSAFSILNNYLNTSNGTSASAVATTMITNTLTHSLSAPATPAAPVVTPPKTVTVNTILPPAKQQVYTSVVNTNQTTGVLTGQVFDGSTPANTNASASVTNNLTGQKDTVPINNGLFNDVVSNTNNATMGTILSQVGNLLAQTQDTLGNSAPTLANISVISNGNGTATITGTVLQGSTPVAGASMAFSSTSGQTSGISSTITNAAGQFTTTYTASTYGTIADSVGVFDNGSYIGSISVNFTYSQPAPTTVNVTVPAGISSGTTETFTPTATVYDQNGNAMAGQTLTWSIQGGTPTGVSIDSTTGVVTIDETVATTPLNFALQATDGGAMGTINVTYTPPVTTPVATAIYISNTGNNTPFGTTTTTDTFSATVFDQNGNTMTGQSLTWSIQGTTPAGVSIDPVMGTVTIDDTIYNEAGFTIQVTDGSTTGTYDFTASVPAWIVIFGNTTSSNGSTWTDTTPFQVHDQYGVIMNAQTLTWSIQGNMPTGVSIDSTTGVVTIDETVATTPLNFALQATDGGAMGTINVTYTPPVVLVPSMVVISVGAATTNAAGTQVTYNPTATVQDQNGNAMAGQTLTWSIQGGTPTGVTLNSTTGLITINTATYAGSGFILKANVDSVGDQASVTYTKPAPAPTTVNVTVPAGISSGTTETFTPTATVYDQNGNAMAGQTLTWSIQGGTPTGVSIDSATGVVTIDETVATTPLNFALQATDGGAMGTINVTYTPPVVLVPSMVVISVGAATTNAAGTQVTYNPTATVQDQNGNAMAGQTVTWSIQGGTPTGVSIDSTTGLITINTATYAGSGFILKANVDSVGDQASVTYTKPAPAPTTVNVTVPAGISSGTTETFAPTATVIDQYGNAMAGQTLTWSIQGGTPTGVSIDSTTGVVTIDETTYTATGFTVQATDGGISGTAVVLYTAPSYSINNLTIKSDALVDNNATVTGSVYVNNSPVTTPTTFNVSAVNGLVPATVTTDSNGNFSFTYTPPSGAVVGSTVNDPLTFTLNGTTIGSNSVNYIVGEINIPIGTNSGPSAIAYGNGYVYVANVGDDTISVINTSTNTITATINVGSDPDGITYGNGYVYVANQIDNTVSVINTLTNTVTATINVGNTPEGVTYSNGYVYVANYSDDTVSVINASTNTVTATIPVGIRPEYITYGNGSVYVSNEGTNTVNSTVSIINATNNTVTTTINVATYSAGIAYGNGYVYVAIADGNAVSVINTTNNTITATVTVGSGPEVITYGNGYLYVVDGTTISIINTATNNTVTTIDFANPAGVAYAQNGYVYVTNWFDGTVAVFKAP